MKKRTLLVLGIAGIDQTEWSTKKEAMIRIDECRWVGMGQAIDKANLWLMARDFPLFRIRATCHCQE